MGNLLIAQEMGSGDERDRGPAHLKDGTAIIDSCPFFPVFVSREWGQGAELPGEGLFFVESRWRP